MDRWKNIDKLAKDKSKCSSLGEKCDVDTYILYILENVYPSKSGKKGNKSLEFIKKPDTFKKFKKGVIELKIYIEGLDDKSRKGFIDMVSDLIDTDSSSVSYDKHHIQQGGSMTLDGHDAIDQELLIDEEDFPETPEGYYGNELKFQIVKTDSGHYFRRNGLMNWIRSSRSNDITPTNPLTGVAIRSVRLVPFDKIKFEYVDGRRKLITKEVDNSDLGEQIYPLPFLLGLTFSAYEQYQEFRRYIFTEGPLLSASIIMSFYYLLPVMMDLPIVNSTVLTVFAGLSAHMFYRYFQDDLDGGGTKKTNTKIENLLSKYPPKSVNIFYEIIEKFNLIISEAEKISSTLPEKVGSKRTKKRRKIMNNKKRIKNNKKRTKNKKKRTNKNNIKLLK